ncbi:MAG: 6,7-dimethyl-8-ribityllumazine synthase [Saprospiraceae bacterium]
MSKTTNLVASALPDLPNMEGYAFAIINTAWNRNITEKLEVGAMKTLIAHKVKKNDIKVYTVPGSFELVHAARRVIKSADVHAVICLGCIIKGETPHDIYICHAVSQGIMQLNIETKVPVIFGVLTTNTMEQALERAGGSIGNKGVEAAYTAMQMALFNHHL